MRSINITRILWLFCAALVYVMITSPIYSYAASSSLNLKWNPPSNGGTVVGYYIYYGTSNNLDSMERIDTMSPVTTYTVKNLQCGHYYVYIKAYNGSGEGPLSDVKQTDIIPGKTVNLRIKN